MNSRDNRRHSLPGRRRASTNVLGVLLALAWVFQPVPIFAQETPAEPTDGKAEEGDPSKSEAANDATSPSETTEGGFHQEDDASEGLEAQRTQELEAKVDDLNETLSRLQDEMDALRQSQDRAATAEEEETDAPFVKEPDTGKHADHARLSDHHTRLPVRDTVRGEHEMTARPGNAPLDPSFVNFFQLGTTGAWMKIGGYVKLDMIMDSTPTGSPPQFMTSAIYVDSQPEFGGPAAFNMHAKQSRIDLELRMATPLGAMRAVYGNDFFGDSESPAMVYQLRNLYVQVANLLVGYTWTTFFDADALPDTLDFAGPGIAAGVQQAQVRYTISLFGGHGHLALALEQPQQDIGDLPVDASARLVAPDFTTALRVEEPWGHVQLGGLARYLTYQQANAPGPGAFAWGLNLAAALTTFGKDQFVANVTGGQGLGHYVQDFDPGYAAVVEANGDLQALTTWGGLAGYLHHWSDRWRTQISYGYVQLVSVAGQAPTTYDHTHYAQANLIWSITPELSIGVEGLYGELTTRDLSRGDDFRGQFSIQYSVF